MRLLLDENVNIKLLPFFQTKGHDATRIPPGTKNGDIVRLAVQENRVLITNDTDFLDHKRYPPSRCRGIICLRIHPPSLDKITYALELLFDRTPEGEFPGACFTLWENDFEKSA